jgi:hypothetical protein
LHHTSVILAGELALFCAKIVNMTSVLSILMAAWHAVKKSWMPWLVEHVLPLIPEAGVWAKGPVFYEES